VSERSEPPERRRAGSTERTHGVRRRGVFGGERVWLWIGAGALGLRFATRLLASEGPAKVIERLEPGHTIIVRHLGPGE